MRIEVKLEKDELESAIRLYLKNELFQGMTVHIEKMQLWTEDATVYLTTEETLMEDKE